jgi:hypothetical protein
MYFDTCLYRRHLSCQTHVTRPCDWVDLAASASLSGVYAEKSVRFMSSQFTFSRIIEMTSLADMQGNYEFQGRSSVYSLNSRSTAGQRSGHCSTTQAYEQSAKGITSFCPHSLHPHRSLAFEV